MKIINKKLAVLLVFLLTLSSQGVFAEYTLEFKGNANKTEYMGESSETYLTIFDINSSNYELIYRKNLIDGSTKSIHIENYHGGDVSKDGAKVVWLEQTTSQDSLPSSTLKIYNFEDPTEIETILSSNEDIISSPTFLSNDKILYRLGHVYSRGDAANNSVEAIVYTQMIVYDLTNNTQESIYVLDLEETEENWYSIEDTKLSGDGTTILFLQNDFTYECSNCIIQNNESLNTYKFSSGTVNEVVSGLIGPNYEISHDAEYVLFTNYTDDAKVTKIKFDDNSSQTIDLSNYLDSSYTLLNRVFDIAISEDASTIAFSGLSEYKDKRQYSYNENYLGGDEKQKQFTGIYVLNIDENNAALVNKFNNSQIIPAQLVSLSKDGTKVRLKTSEQTEKYISYDVDYAFHADAAVTGAWYNPEQSGHGLMVNFSPDADHPKGQALVTWYTVDIEGNPLWLVMQASFNGNTLTGDAIQVTGSVFGNYDPTATTRTVWGTLSLDFSDCNTALLSYQPNQDGYQAGEMSLSRLSYQSGIGCL